MTFKRSKETKWNQIEFNFYKYVQANKCPVTGDSKHDYLFHKRRTSDLSNKEPEYKEKNLTYKQVENLIN